MARLTFPNTAQGMAGAEAVAQPRHIIWSQAKITVLTGADLPEAQRATDAVLSRVQLLRQQLLLSTT